MLFFDLTVAITLEFTEVVLIYRWCIGYLQHAALVSSEVPLCTTCSMEQ